MQMIMNVNINNCSISRVKTQTMVMLDENVTVYIIFRNEPHREKTNILHMRKQRRRSASR